MDKPNIVPYSYSIMIMLYSVTALMIGFYCIRSMSMAPTLLDGGIAIVRKLSYGFPMKRGSIIAVGYPFKAATYIKRVLGLPGDKVTYSNHIKKLYIVYKGITSYIQGFNPQKNMLSNILTNRIHSILTNLPRKSSRIIGVCLPRNNCFVVGDSLYRSYDSRSWGVLPGNQTIGIIIAIWNIFFLV